MSNPGLRVRYSMLAITVNTNRAATTAAEEDYYKRGLRKFIEIDLAVVDNWRRLLPMRPDFSAIDHIDVSAIGIERGPKRHRIHAHFVVTIQHHGQLRLNRFLKYKWQDLVNSKLEYTRGSNVQVDLLNSRHLNYVSKHSGGIKTILNLGVQEPVIF